MSCHVSACPLTHLRLQSLGSQADSSECMGLRRRRWTGSAAQHWQYLGAGLLMKLKYSEIHHPSSALTHKYVHTIHRTNIIHHNYDHNPSDPSQSITISITLHKLDGRDRLDVGVGDILGGSTEVLPEGLTCGESLGTSVEAEGDKDGGALGRHRGLRGAVPGGPGPGTPSFRGTGEMRRLRRLDSGEDGPNMTSWSQKRQRRA